MGSVLIGKDIATAEDESATALFIGAIRLGEETELGETAHQQFTLK